MYLEKELGPGSLRLLHTLKTAIDPLSIMNPGSLLYETEEERQRERMEMESYEH